MAILSDRKVNDKYAESALEAAKTLIQKEINQKFSWLHRIFSILN